MVTFLLGMMAAAAASASPHAPPEPKQASIPFVSSNGIQQYQADGSRGLFIKDISGRWYYAKMMSDCPRLSTSDTLGFQTVGGDQLDKFGTIIAQGWRCPIASLTASDAPPKKKR